MFVVNYFPGEITAAADGLGIRIAVALTAVAQFQLTIRSTH